MSRQRPGGKAIWISLGIHAAIVAPMAVFARPPAPIEFESIKVQLVSPPPSETVSPQPSPPVEVQPQPEPEPEVVEPEPEAVVEREPPPEEPPEKEVERPKTETPPDPKPQPTPPKTTKPDTAAIGGEGLNINTEGREFPYPAYIENVLVQVRRYFRWNDQSRPKGVVYFEIQEDGSVRNIRMYRSSGNVRFDFAVQGAVETAGDRGAFGPLPEGYAAPSLPVMMEIEPPR